MNQLLPLSLGALAVAVIVGLSTDVRAAARGLLARAGGRGRAEKCSS